MSADFQFDGGFTSESWEYARAFASSLGPLPSSFTSVIRLLISDFDKDPSSLTEIGRFFAGRLLKAPTIQAPYFYAVRYLKPMRIREGEPFELRDFLNTFNGYEHACLLSAIFLYRHSRRVCQQDLLERLVPRLQRGMNLGWFIGNALPSVGTGAGLLVGAFRTFGLLPFLRHDVEGFRRYHSYLNVQDMLLDANYEFQRWQCNSLQVALMLCQQMGFGVGRIIPLLRAVTTSSPLLNSDDLERTFRVIDVWMESLSTHKSAPSIPLPPKYYPGARELNELIQRAESSLDTPEASWLVRTKNDLSPETTPELFMNQEPEPELPPSDLQGALPEETINELSSKFLKDFLREEPPQE